jgi:hypothetical protein
LGSLAERIRNRVEAAVQGTGDFKDGDADLATLDWAVERSFEIARQLQAAGSWLGKVHPENVLIVEPAGPGERELILSDWGFANNPAYNFGEVPAWVSSSPWGVLWDYAPSAMNEAVLQGGRPQEKGVDRRTLARLLVCLLVGREEVERWCSDAPRSRRGGSRLNDLPRNDPKTKAELWVKLGEALRDQIGIDALAAYLRAQPMSRHFRKVVADRREQEWRRKEEARRRRRQRVLRLGAGTSLLVVVLAGGFIGLKSLGYFDPPAPRHYLCPDCPGESPLKPGLEGLAAARGQGRGAEIQALAALYGLAAQEGHAATAAERDCLAKLRAETLEDLRRDFVAISKTLTDGPAAADTECARLAELAAQVDAVLQLDSQASHPTWLETLKERRRWHCGPSKS